MRYILWPTMGEAAGQKEEIESKIRKLGAKSDFELIPVVADNWNDDLSPWKYEDKGSSFGGKAELFLERMLDAAERIAKGAVRLLSVE